MFVANVVYTGVVYVGIFSLYVYCLETAYMYVQCFSFSYIIMAYGSMLYVCRDGPEIKWRPQMTHSIKGLHEPDISLSIMTSKAL